MPSFSQSQMQTFKNYITSANTDMANGDPTAALNEIQQPAKSVLPEVVMQILAFWWLIAAAYGSTRIGVQDDAEKVML